MGTLNDVQVIEQRVRERFVESETALDAAQEPGGPWFLDVKLNGRRIVVEWRPQRGLGITTTPDSGYGEGADEVYQALAPAWRRLCALLTILNAVPQQPGAA